tara:strand:+ start:2849 stop:3898 length:1050 start_codon:yes stop_codon:yes gene_type:complete
MHDWKKIILKPDDSMKTAIHLLESEALRIVMIADNDNVLMGTLTDGDIRRALIQHRDMDTHVSEIMYKDPTTVFPDDSVEMSLAIMTEKNLLQLPVVDKKGKIVGLRTIKSSLDIKKYDNLVFLMAGGFGKRLQPLTNKTPKPLIRIGEKPILETILNQFIDSGFNNFIISTHYKAQMLKEYFGDGSKWNVNISYVYEENPLGTAGALGLLPPGITDLPILIMNGDLLTKVNFKNLLEFHNKNTGVASMCVREYDLQVPYGVVNSNDNRVTNIIEKPIHKFFVNAGIYVLNPSILDSLDGKTYMDMPNFIQAQINNDLEVNTFPLHEYWLDVGHMEQLKQAQHDSKSIF